MSSIPTLQALPVELQLIVMSYLPFDAAKALSYTNHYFHDLTDPTTLLYSLEDKQEFVARAERWQLFRWAKYLSCSKCVRMLHTSRFGEAQKRNKRYPGGKEAGKRFCLDCGVSEEYYNLGSTVKVRGVDFLLCHACKKLTAQDLASRSAIQGFCLECSSRVSLHARGGR